ncbi:MAG: DUF4142 domain-containing protein [Gemmatimonadaceae bacterium]|nr:DUF4142 domain-containing protein [Gemmatimonadaceae bacterium]
MLTIRALLLGTLVLASSDSLGAQAKLNDLEMAHVAVTADAIDIEYAKLVLRQSKNSAVREFAETMIRDHTAVTAQVVALARKLNVQAQDNAFSQQLVTNSVVIKEKLGRLRGVELDRFYAQNELGYHKAVNSAVADQFIPNIQNAEVKKAFVGALALFRGHELHAETMVAKLGK